MGIKNLLKFLLQKSSGIKPILITDYSHKKIAVDTSIILYQSVITIRNSGSDLLNRNGELASHILGLFNKTIELLEKNIFPIFIFDGKPPSIKKNMLNARKQVRQKALDKLLTTIDEETKIKCFKKSVNITREHNEQCREMLNYMGIPYINADEEADKTLAYLCKNKMVDGVLSEDMDILTFGSPILLRNLLATRNGPLEISLESILDSLNLTMEQFIDLCMLFGCDYCKPIISEREPNIIYDIYYETKSIEKTKEKLLDLGYIINEINDYDVIKVYFMNISHSEINNIEMKKPDMRKLGKLLIEKYDLDKNRIISKLKRLKNIHPKYEKKNIIEMV